MASPVVSGPDAGDPSCTSNWVMESVCLVHWGCHNRHTACRPTQQVAVSVWRLQGQDQGVGSSGSFRHGRKGLCQASLWLGMVVCPCISASGSVCPHFPFYGATSHNGLGPAPQPHSLTCKHSGLTAHHSRHQQTRETTHICVCLRSGAQLLHPAICMM